MTSHTHTRTQAHTFSIHARTLSTIHPMARCQFHATRSAPEIRCHNWQNKTLNCNSKPHASKRKQQAQTMVRHAQQLLTLPRAQASQALQVTDRHSLPRQPKLQGRGTTSCTALTLQAAARAGTFARGQGVWEQVGAAGEGSCVLALREHGPLSLLLLLRHTQL